MKRVLSLTLALTYFSSCATIFHGTTDQISVHSNEPGTKIYLDNQEIGTDNAVYAVPKKGDHIIRVSKNGCSDTITPIRYSFDGVTLLGILLDAGLISILVVDLGATGATTKADQTSYVLTPSCNVASTAAPQRSTAGHP